MEKKKILHEPRGARTAQSEQGGAFIAGCGGGKRANRHRRARLQARTIALGLGLCAPLLFSGCIVVPIGDLLREPSLEERILVEGEGVFTKEKIAVIDLDGTISAEGDGGLLFPRENTVAQIKARLDRARDDDEVRAVVLAVSSPGGEVTACDVLHREVKRFREETGKPVVAVIEDSGTSGAYYVAVAADTIIAHPTAVVGSIGVVLASFDLSGLLEKLGIAVAPVKSAPMKDINSPFRRATEEERQVLQRLVDALHERFVDVVDRGRPNLPREKIAALADGRIVTGEEARELGLVDRVGYLDDAVREAAERAGVSSPTVVRYRGRVAGGATLYARRAEALPPAELRISFDPAHLPRPRFLYLWRPGL